jgi:hypothetical protein
MLLLLPLSNQFLGLSHYHFRELREAAIKKLHKFILKFLSYYDLRLRYVHIQRHM